MEDGRPMVENKILLVSCYLCYAGGFNSLIQKDALRPPLDHVADLAAGMPVRSLCGRQRAAAPRRACSCQDTWPTGWRGALTAELA